MLIYDNLVGIMKITGTIFYYAVGASKCEKTALNEITFFSFTTPSI